MNEVPNNLTNTNYAGNDDALSVTSFSGFFRELLKKWWLFLIVGLVLGIAGFFYAKAQKPQYESNLTFVLDQGGNNAGITGALSLAAQFGLNIGAGGNDIFSGDNILEVIKSRRIVENVFLSADSFNGKRYTLIEYFLRKVNPLNKEQSEKYKDVHFPDGQMRSSFTYLQDSLLYSAYLKFINLNIEADRPDKKLSIFSIRVKTGDEKFTKIFTDKLIHAADSFYTEISSKKAKETLEILEQRVASMKGNLSSSITSRAMTQDANMNPAFSAAQIPLQKQQANIQVYGGAYGEMFKNLELARFQYLNKIPLIQIIDQADYPMKKIKTGKLITSIMFALAGIFSVILVMWLIRIYKLNNR